MTSLVIGASGQVGALLHQLCRQRGHCVGTYWRNALSELVPLDVSKRSTVEKLFHETRPSHCFLPASMTHVDYAEQHPDECSAINVEGTRNVAEAVRQLNGWLVFFSTEYIFPDGKRPWTEDDAPKPTNVYARSKVQGEEIIRQLLPNKHLILRTSWAFGPDPQQKNFFWRVRQALRKRQPLKVSNDQYGQPTYGPDLAAATLKLIDNGACGTFHVVGPRKLSRLDWARAIAEELGFSTDSIQGVPTSSFSAAAPRPFHAELGREKLVHQLGHDPIRLPEEGVRELQRIEPHVADG